MADILVVYSTVDGHTREICERIRDLYVAEGHAVTLQSLDQPPAPDPAEFDRVMIGASIRYGKHRPNVKAYIDRHQRALEERPSALFSVNLVARTPGRSDPSTNPYLAKFLRRLDWKPPLVTAFAGKLDYPSYGFRDRQIIRLIMWITKGPTDPSAVVDFTDYERVGAFSKQLLGLPVRGAG